VPRTRTTISAAAEPRWASLAQASTYSTIPVKTLRDWISKGRLPAFRVGPRQIRVDLNDIDGLMRRIPTAGADR
jgi:excisionase family DNA binding protein